MIPSGLTPAPRSSEPATICLLVDADLYPAILSALDDYAADLLSAGYAVFTETVTGGTPEEIKAWVQARYDSGSAGIVFVGDITAAWAEVSGSVFPCDLFYMDLDGHWEDADVDGDYETHNAGTGDEGPELYVARINAHTLDYDTEANMVNAYFGKAHAYLSGGLQQPWHGLEYVDEDWWNMEVDLNLVYGDDVVRYDYGYFTTAADYLNQMDLGQHFVQVCAHSYSGGHHFGTRPTESAVYAHTYVYSPSSRSARLRLTSDDGIKVWVNGDLLGTWDLPGTIVVAYTTLNQGWNQLLCKISQAGGSYSFSAKLADLDGNPFPDLDYQLDDPDTHGQAGQFIRGWLLNGFHQDTSDNFWSYLSTNYLGTDHGALNPQEGQVMGGQTWTAYTANGGFVDLGDHCAGADFGVCYAFARVYAPAEVSCQLWTSYDDGAKIWLNGDLVLYDNRSGAFQLDMTKIDVTLDPGENRLLFKVSEWMGTHGFSARFCYTDGTLVPGLTYDPPPAPVSHIGDWLLNGPHVNPDPSTRLSEDYLGGEAGVAPSTGDPAPFGTWEQGTDNGDPFDIGAFYDQGEYVTSQTIQDRDPPVLFYNLFACGPGRFTDANYLAGAYIFNTTYGLITVASAKSGSMLNFHEYTGPLGQGATVGTAFCEWFDAQAPFELWEREWYYGMVLCGDPTLQPIRAGDLDTDGDVDLSDFATFARCYGLSAPLEGLCEPPEFSASDLNDDGGVDLLDFASFALHYGT